MHSQPNGKRSFWIRLVRSPLRDLVRLRVTGRYDVVALVAASQLPEAIQKTVVSGY